MRTWIFSLFILGLAACNGGGETPSATSTPDSTATVPAAGMYKTGDRPLDSLNALLASDPQNARNLAARARIYLNRKDTRNAMADASGARNLDSNSAFVQLVWGEVNFVINRTRLSRDAWQRCIEIDPKNTDCRLKLAELYLAVALYDEAMQQVNKVIELDPTNNTAYYMKGVLIRDKVKDTALAISYFQKAADLNNNDVDALEMLGILYANKKNPLAEAYYRRAIALQPNRADLYFDLGVYFMAIKDWNGALENYTKAVQLKPDYNDALFNLGYIHIELKAWDQARKNFTDAIRANPRDYKSYYARGYCFEAVGDVMNARRDYEESLKYADRYPPSMEGLDRLNRAEAQSR